MMLLVPLLSLVALWAYLTAISFGDAKALLDSDRFQNRTLLPTQRLVDALQKERRLSLAALGARSAARQSELAAQRRATDGARATVERYRKDPAAGDTLEPPSARAWTGCCGSWASWTTSAAWSTGATPTAPGS
ncbi:nitrate- and nitrite sensing domain-containing protein [Actinomadura keratinilytica]|uniref:nitrate- and nitrite sensing domain-containing protein n=1 Tax=Actinomadura keratinilytica TaxID=547461 RepID=UPI0036240C4E